MFYKVVNAILLFGGKENANERKESLLLICRVQLFFCKDTTFPRNFQGFREKILEKGEEKKKIGDSRNGGEPPIEYCCFDDETKDYLFFDFPMASKCRRTNTLYSFLSL